MQLLLAARDYLAGLHPLAPWLALLEAIFLPQYLVRKYRPKWWEWAATFGWRVAPETTFVAMALKVWQGLPSVLAGALFTAYMSGGDPRAAFYGALVGAAAPLRHELLKRLPNSVVPYVGGSYPAASTAPRTPPPAVPPFLVFLVALGLTVAAGMQGCGGNPEVVRAPGRADAGRQSAGTIIPMPEPEPQPEAAPPSVEGFGAVVVTMQTADGVVHAILCGGEVASDLGPAAACPYEHGAGRTLLKLEREGGQ